MFEEKNVWYPFEVQGVNIGDCIHVYKEERKDVVTTLYHFGKLIRENVKTVEDYYVIALLSEHVGFYVPQLVIDKFPFERLYKSKHTRIIDYFIMAKNCVGVYLDGEEIPEIPHSEPNPCGFDYVDEDTMKIYSFEENETNTRFSFIISFT